MKKNKILIIFAHPLYEKSRVNQIINQYIPNNENITFHDLYELYPDFEINIKLEQKLILDHDIIIWQHPMYWYSCPSLLKQWMDMVLHFRGDDVLDINQLKGKCVMQLLTLGNQTNTFLDKSPDEISLLDYLLPFKKTVEYSNMIYLPPFFLNFPQGKTFEKINKRGEEYGYILEAMLSNFVSAQDFGRFETMNEWLNSKNKTFG